MLLSSLQTEKKPTVWVFPGQGSQKLGMGRELLNFPLTQLRLQQAEYILGWSISKLWQSDDHQLSHTQYTQPCLYVFMTLLVDFLKRSGYQPNVVSGYSFGEYVALYAAEAYDFETGLKLIKKRAEIMSRLPQGSMVTLIGYDREKLKQVILDTPNVWLANDNLKYAILSGTSEAITSVLSRVAIDRVVPLPVSAAFHTPLVETAAEEFEEILDTVDFQPFSIPVFCSVDLTLSFNINQIKRNLIQQISQPVRWQMISETLVMQGIQEALQIGCGQGLLKVMKQIDPRLEINNIGSTADIDSMVIRDQLRKLSIANPEIVER
ncbi:FabD-like acyl transferase [Crocosphaera subtropica ATCC 51142]|uniref:Malonyl CoA-acyl carrier protein transacylase n=1 Tax=Crocosphaera subtropica (strain ATCC 51142 / BH68) TaxID=43989 RepID=B1WZ09_CROS5|nr:acyltransferase domain-containing protein [Crocosphaera subtropica]ACB52773.1 FabD-like acyl transferase [Crocosphaera subtropica ATCC 51142]